MERSLEEVKQQAVLQTHVKPFSNSTTSVAEDLQRWNKEPEFVAEDASSSVFFFFSLGAGVTWNWLTCDLQTFILSVTSLNLLTDHSWSLSALVLYDAFDVATAVSPCDETYLMSSHLITWTVKSHLCPSPHEAPTHCRFDKWKKQSIRETVEEVSCSDLLSSSHFTEMIRFCCKDGYFLRRFFSITDLCVQEEWLCESKIVTIMFW